MWMDFGCETPRRFNTVFLFPSLISLGLRSGVPFLPESAKVCQSYFCFYFNRGFGKPHVIGLNVEAFRGLSFCPVAAGPSKCMRVLAPFSGFPPRLKAMRRRIALP